LGEEVLMPAAALKPTGPDQARTPEPNRETRPPEIFPEDELDEIAAEELDEWEKQVSPVLDPVVAMIREADSYEEIISKLPDMVEEMDATKVIESLARAAFKARGMGDATDEV